MTNPHKAWPRFLLVRRSAGEIAPWADLERELDLALAAGRTIDQVQLCQDLLGLGNDQVPLVCQILAASTRHLDFENCAQALHMVVSKGADIELTNPLDHLFLSMDSDELRPSFLPIFELLIKMGADLPGMVDRRGREWILQRLQEEGDDDSAEYFDQVIDSMMQARALGTSTPRAASSKSSNRL